MRSWVLVFILVLVSFFTVHAQVKCAEFESILADACGAPEGKNEMFRFKVGLSNLSTSNLTVTWSSNPWLGVCQNARTAQNISALNKTIKKCGWLLEPVGGILPVGREVLFITSENMDTLANSFGDLQDTLYVVFQCGNASTGHFKNYQGGAGSRTTILNFSGSGGCADTAVYMADSLIDQAGNLAAADGAYVNFNNNGTPSYFNNGCTVPVPVMDLDLINPDTTVCGVGSISLSGIAVNYKRIKWKGGAGVFSQPDSLRTVYTASANETYPIKLYLMAYSNCQGDSLMDSIVVSRYIPLGSAGTNSMICAGGNILLGATGGSAYIWDPSPFLSCTVCASPTASPVSTTRFFVTITDIHSCTHRDSVLVTVMNYPTTTISNDTVICRGSSVNLFATGASSYTWSSNYGTSSLSCVLCSNPLVTPSQTTTYYVTTGANCRVIDSVTVSLTNSLIADIQISASQLSICPGTMVIFAATPLNGGGMPEYKWMKNGMQVGGNSNTYSDSLLVTGDQIQCVLQSSLACISNPIDSSNIVFISLTGQVIPTISIFSPDTNICQGQVAGFMASIQNGGTNPLVSWYVNGTEISNSSGSGSVFNFANFNDGDVIAAKLESNAACQALDTVFSNSIVIRVNPISQPAITISADTTTVCSGDTIHFSSNVTDGGLFPSYQWFLSGAASSGSGSSFDFISTSSGISVSCELTSDKRCAVPTKVMSNTIAVTVIPILNPTMVILSDDSSVCKNEPLVLYAESENAGDLPIYSWSKNDTVVNNYSNTFTDFHPRNGDVYACMLTSNATCAAPIFARAVFTGVSVSDYPEAEAGGDTTIEQGNIIMLLATGGEDYQWSGEQIISSSNSADIQIAPLQTGLYYVTVANTEGCSAIDSVLVIVKESAPLFIPNAFTPNGDDRNDIFQLYNAQNYRYLDLRIYNRWGELVFESQDSSQGWDGSFRDQFQPTGTYVYFLKATPKSGETEEYSGSLTLLR